MYTRPQRRGLASFAVAGVAALLLAACGGESTDSGVDGGTVTLTMWARSDDEGFLPDLVDEFNAAHDDIRVELTLVPAAQVVQKYSTAASSGSGPDIVAVEIGTLPQFTSTGWLQDITDFVDGLDYKDTLSPAHLSQGSVDDRVYGVPLSADVSVLYWNKTLFEEAGLDPEAAPAAWADIRTAAEAVTALGDGTSGYFFSGGCAGCMAFTMLPYVWAGGGDVLETSGDSAVATLDPNPELASALEFLRGMVDDGLVPATAQTENGSDQFGPFFSQTVGMFVQGTYPFAQLKANYPDVDFGITPVPSEDGGASASFAGGDDVALTADADTEAGLTVLAWLLDEGQQSLADKGILPVRSDIATDSYVGQDPRHEVFVEALAVGHTPKAAKVSSVFFDNNGPFGGLVQQAIFGDQAVDDALADAQAAAEAVLSQ
ncbi:sugar ABC transporter substrate-binding protein [Jiangella ureilytica]|uniref:Sugar ABC transporter substrate-binding protein n=1 Tax=Jiangella ureilytica TaxID=2530374 RepID=A0A4R4RF96_9ACTN|nr:sugar ABC transporter substrate-binding protein [Jiangella ureilytica]TDC48041.1 sugar ABC transporter substrate-binding protein [Jiangella ureilytica]